MNEKDRISLELYLYMGNAQPVINWLNKQGVKTKKEAKEKLSPLVGENMRGVMGSGSGSLAGTANAVERILAKYK